MMEHCTICAELLGKKKTIYVILLWEIYCGKEEMINTIKKLKGVLK